MVASGGCGRHRRRHGDAQGTVGDRVVGRRVGKSSGGRRVVHARVGETRIGKG